MSMAFSEYCTLYSILSSTFRSLDLHLPRLHKKALAKYKIHSVQTMYHRKQINTEEKAKVVCLGDRIYSIPCRASYFAQGRIEE